MNVTVPFLLGALVAGLPAGYAMLRLIRRTRADENVRKAEEARAFALEQTLAGIPDGFYFAA